MVRPRTLAVITLLVGLALCLAPRPGVDNSANALLEAGHEGLSDYTEFQRLFGTDEVIVARVEHPDLQVVLQEVSELTELFQNDSTMERVVSPTLVYHAELDLLSDEDLGGMAELPRLAPRFQGPLNRALELLDTEHPRATIYALGRVLPAQERIPLANALEARKRAFSEKGGRILLAGPALLNLELDRAGRDVSGKALPLLALVAVVFLLLNTRSVILSTAVLGTTALGVFAGDGVLGLLGISTNIIVDISKPLLLVLILASGLHVAIAFVHERQTNATPAEAARTVIAAKRRAVVLALLTTAIGFGSLAVSSVVPIRRFGMIAAGGCLFGIPLVLVLLPAILGIVGGRVRPQPEGRLEAFSVATIRFSRAHRGPIIAVALLSLVAGTLALFQLTPDPHAIKYFPKDHPLRVDYEALEASGLGLSTLELVVSSTAGFQRRAQLDKLDRVAVEAGALPGIHAAVALPLFMREASFRAGGNDQIPEQPLIDQAMKERASELSDFLSADRKKARVSLLIESLDADRIDQLDAALRTLVARELPGAGLLVTGNYRLLLSTQRSLIDTMKQSLLGTAILMELAFLLLLRAPLLSLAALVPNVFPVAVNYLLMWLLGIPLDLGTAMTGAIALGIAVDNTFHFIDGWRQHGAEATARSTGRAMIVTSIVIGAGFLSLLISDFGPTRNFGMLTGIVMLSALFGDMCVLTPMLDLVARRGDE